jgi:hypothetical protein
MKIAVKRNIVDYVGATKNEILVDERLFSLLGETPDALGFLPRVPKWIGWGRRFPWMTRTLGHVVRMAWLCGGAVLVFSMNLIAAWLRTPGQPSAKPSEHERCSNYILALSDRVENIMTRPPFVDDPFFLNATWVCVPWVPVQQKAGFNYVHIFSLLTRRELLQAFADAVTASYVLWLHRRTSRWALQSYTAFRWFAVRRALEKLDGALITCEHYDRWAVLVDTAISPRNRNRSRLGSGRNEMVLVQHGYMGSLSGDQTGPSQLPIHRRLQSVNRMYLYDVGAKEVFLTAVVSRGCAKRGVATTFFRPSIELTVMSAEKRTKILFVGHPLCEEFQISVMKNLASRAEFVAYYKPHPKAGMSSNAMMQAWTVIDDPECFPAVDFLVSYPSTLVTEYEGAGIEACVHPLDHGSADTESFVDSLLRYIAADEESTAV